jgi:hypothetical protein
MASGGTLEALQAQVRSVQADFDLYRQHVDDILGDFSFAVVDLRTELFETADAFEDKEDGADVARQLRELAADVDDVESEIEDVKNRAEAALDGMDPVADALETIADLACALDDPADDGGDDADINEGQGTDGHQ